MDIVTSVDRVATINGHYTIPAAASVTPTLFRGQVPHQNEPFHEEFEGPFDVESAFHRAKEKNGIDQARGCRIVVPLRANEFIDGYGLLPGTRINGIRITVPLEAGAQEITLTLRYCSTHPAIVTVGQLAEFAKPVNRPNAFGERFRQAKREFQANFPQAWEEAADAIRAAYSEPMQRGKLLDSRNDGWEERKRFRDLERIEVAAVEYLSRLSAALRDVSDKRKAEIAKAQAAVADVAKAVTDMVDDTQRAARRAARRGQLGIVA